MIDAALVFFPPTACGERSKLYDPFLSSFLLVYCRHLCFYNSSANPLWSFSWPEHIAPTSAKFSPLKINLPNFLNPPNVMGPLKIFLRLQSLPPSEVRIIPSRLESVFPFPLFVFSSVDEEIWSSRVLSFAFLTLSKTSVLLGLCAAGLGSE